MPQQTPPQLLQLMARCWKRAPAERADVNAVLARLYALREQAGAGVEY